MNIIWVGAGRNRRNHTLYGNGWSCFCHRVVHGHRIHFFVESQRRFSVHTENAALCSAAAAAAAAASLQSVWRYRVIWMRDMTTVVLHVGYASRYTNHFPFIWWAREGGERRTRGSRSDRGKHSVFIYFAIVRHSVHVLCAARRYLYHHHSRAEF